MAQWAARRQSHVRDEIISELCQRGERETVKEDKKFRRFIETWNFYTGLFPLNNITMHYMEDEESNK